MDEYRIDSLPKASIESVTPRLDGGAPEGTSFSGLIEQLIGSTNKAQLDANDKAEKLANGEAGTVETVLAIHKADLSLRLMLEVRNRALQAYQEITRAV